MTKSKTKIQLSKDKHTLSGYSSKVGTRERRNILTQLVYEKGYLKVMRRLNAIAVLNKNKPTGKKLRSDVNWIVKRNKEENRKSRRKKPRKKVRKKSKKKPRKKPRKNTRKKPRKKTRKKPRKKVRKRTRKKSKKKPRKKVRKKSKKKPRKKTRKKSKKKPRKKSKKKPRKKVRKTKPRKKTRKKPRKKVRKTKPVKPRNEKFDYSSDYTDVIIRLKPFIFPKGNPAKNKQLNKDLQDYYSRARTIIRDAITYIPGVEKDDEEYLVGGFVRMDLHVETREMKSSLLQEPISAKKFFEEYLIEMGPDTWMEGDISYPSGEDTELHLKLVSVK